MAGGGNKRLGAGGLPGSEPLAMERGRAMSKTGDKYIKMPGGLLCEPSLKLAEKVFLAMVYTFNSGGLRLGNKQLGQILGMNQSNASRMIARLQADGWIRITGKQSRWRRIYFASGDKVNDVLLCSKQGFTLLLATPYFASSGKQKDSKEKKEGKKDISFSAVVDSEPETTYETTPAKEPPTPERMRAVMENLGFIKGQAI